MADRIKPPLTPPPPAGDPSTNDADEKALWIPRCPLCHTLMGLNHALRHNPQRAYQCVNPNCHASQKAKKGAKVKRIGG